MQLLALRACWLFCCNNLHNPDSHENYIELMKFAEELGLAWSGAFGYDNFKNASRDLKEIMRVPKIKIKYVIDEEPNDAATAFI